MIKYIPLIVFVMASVIAYQFLKYSGKLKSSESVSKSYYLTENQPILSDAEENKNSTTKAPTTDKTNNKINKVIAEMVTNDTFGAFCAGYFSTQSKTYPDETSKDSSDIYELVAAIKLQDQKVSKPQDELMRNLGEEISSNLLIGTIGLGANPDAKVAKELMGNIEFIENLCRTELIKFAQSLINKYRSSEIVTPL